MKPYWKNGIKRKGPPLPSSCGDAPPGLEGDADWSSFCAASFADSAQNSSPRTLSPRTRENPAGPSSSWATRRDALGTLGHL
ncbi:unnamed protein product [Ectocarpus sp. CCAP 1310/34]|nr:unnamed protein product [Ectocarpus sp. CCAP 1310/34]